MTAILGINAYHSDAAACLVVDGELISAAEEERFRRVKHWAGFPSEAIRYCVSAAGLRVGNIDLVAINQSNSIHTFNKLFFHSISAEISHSINRSMNHQPMKECT